MTPSEPTQKPRELDLVEASKILKLYCEPYNETIDNGNLFFAACEYREAYERLEKRIEKLREALKLQHNVSSDTDTVHLCYLALKDDEGEK